MGPGAPGNLCGAAAVTLLIRLRAALSWDNAIAYTW